MSEKGIYLEVNNISSVTPSLGKRHSYLVYRDGKGNERVIRGGPASMLGWMVGGDIKVEADVPLSQSIDCYAPGEKPGSRPSRKLDLGPRVAGEGDWTPLKEDGVAEPITTQVFEGIAPRLAPPDFARRFGRFLGLP